MPNYSLQRTVTSQQSSIFPYRCLSLSIPTAVYSLTVECAELEAANLNLSHELWVIYIAHTDIVAS